MDPHLWLPAQALCPGDHLIQMARKEQEALLRTFRSHEREAFLCFRMARWQTDGGRLFVKCLQCGARGWFYCSRGHERRWICKNADNQGPKKRREERPKASRLKVCNKRFWDTSETPFSGSRVPMSYAFLALYYSPLLVGSLLGKVGQQEALEKLKRALLELDNRQHASLKRNLKVMARVFCGKVLCAKYKTMTLKTGGFARMQKKLYAASVERQKKEADHLEQVKKIKSHYAKARWLIQKLERMDSMGLTGAEDTSAQREAIIAYLTTVCRKSPI